MRDLEMAFVGKVAASMTHEIKNTYAIILESAGLLSDLLTFHQEGSFTHKEKFQKVLGNINDQVNRGVILATRLNQFAHSMDEPSALVKVADLLEMVVALMQRLARRRGIELKAVAPELEVSLTCDPFRLQLVLASVIDQLADALESGGKIILQVPPAPQGVTILLEAQGTQKPGWEGLMEHLFATLKNILHALGAELAISSPLALEGVMLTIKTPEP